MEIMCPGSKLLVESLSVSSTHQLRRHMFPLKVPNAHSFSPLLASTALPFHFPPVPFGTACLRCAAGKTSSSLADSFYTCLLLQMKERHC